MSRLLPYLCIFLMAVSAEAQDKRAYFILKDIQLAVPAFLPGIMNDTAAVQDHDTLYYKLKGQLFVNAPVFIDTLPLPYPWKVIGEMINAYVKKDKKKIAALYSVGSRQRVTDLLAADTANEMISYVSEAASANLRILAGIEYKEGFLVYTKDDLHGLHENYIVIEDGKYKLSALDDSSSTGWNVCLYFKFEPKPLQAASIALPDSLHINSYKTLQVVLPEGQSWLALYTADPGDAVQLLVQDNGVNDLNPEKGVVTFELRGRQFVNTGTHRLYVAASNYPLQRISTNMILPELAHQLVVY